MISFLIFQTTNEFNKANLDEVDERIPRIIAKAMDRQMTAVQ